MTATELDWAFVHIPQLAGSTAAEYSITPMPGYTNRNYRLQGQGEDWVLRLPQAETDRFIDRSIEAHNQAIAHRLGLAPAVAWRDDTGITLTPTLRHSRQLRADDFDTRLEAIVEPLRRLHRSGAEFRGHTSLGELLQWHYDLLDAEVRPHYEARMQQAERVLSLLQGDELAWVPSHRDLVMGNLLLEDERLWFIDWEYSSMASPYWDLATLCNEAELDLDQSRRLLQAYSAGGPPMQESRLFDYRGLLKLFTDCWMSLLVEPGRAG